MRWAVTCHREKLFLLRHRQQRRVRIQEAKDRVYQTQACLREREGLVGRRVFARTKWQANGGYKPDYRLKEQHDLQELIWAPPQGATSGVRIFKEVIHI